MSPPVNRRLFTRQGGFTLLEMLVVVTVLGFLIIGLTQGVRTGLTLSRCDYVRFRRRGAECAVNLPSIKKGRLDHTTP